MLKPLSFLGRQLALLKNYDLSPIRVLEGLAQCLVVVGEQSGDAYTESHQILIWVMDQSATPLNMMDLQTFHSLALLASSPLSL
jgi:hypothetical protein